MSNTPNLDLEELSYNSNKTYRQTIENDIMNKINANNLIIDTAISEKITQVELYSELPSSPTTLDNLYIVYGDTDENNGQYRWNGSAYEKISANTNLPNNIVLYDDEEELETPIPVNADTLGGQLPAYYAKQEDLEQITEDATAHKAEITSQLIDTTRDLSLIGTQTISVATGRKIKSATVFGAVTSTNKTCWGAWGINGGGCIYRLSSGGYANGSFPVIISQNGTTDRTFGNITDVQDGSFQINWTHGGAGATGTIGLKILVRFHD